MDRRHNDPYYGPPKGASSRQYSPERLQPQHSLQTRTHQPGPYHDQSGPQRGKLYDPYDPGSSDDEEHHRIVPSQQRGNMSGYEGPGRRDDYPRDSTYPNTRPPDHLSHGHSRPSDHLSHDQPTRSAMSAPGRPLYSHDAYGGQGANGVESDRERVSGPSRITPPRLKVDYGHHSSGFVGSGVDQTPVPSDISRKRSRSPPSRSFSDVSRRRSRSPSRGFEELRGLFSCELCDVELPDSKALENHCNNSKSHWDTLEHVQKMNSYDDMAIAFIQESLLYKVRKGNEVVDEVTMKAMREKEHITKVEMLHCGSCKVYISMAVSSVQNHLNSQEHLRNKKEFGTRQSKGCLIKAENLLSQLKPQYAKFREGKDPFE